MHIIKTILIPLFLLPTWVNAEGVSYYGGGSFVVANSEKGYEETALLGVLGVNVALSKSSRIALEVGVGDEEYAWGVDFVSSLLYQQRFNTSQSWQPFLAGGGSFALLNRDDCQLRVIGATSFKRSCEKATFSSLGVLLEAGILYKYQQAEFIMKLSQHRGSDSTTINSLSIGMNY